MIKTKNILKKSLKSLPLAFLPLIAFAQTGSTLCGPIKYSKSLQWYLCEVYKIIGQYLIPLLMLAATGFFIYGIVMFIKNANNETKRTEYKNYMTWGIVALFVMVSVWGIVAILGQIVGTDTSVIPQIRYK